MMMVLFVFVELPLCVIMGKQQQTKKKQDRREARHNPVRVPDAHLGQGAGSAKAHPAKEQALLPIIDKVSPS